MTYRMSTWCSTAELGNYILELVVRIELTHFFLTKEVPFRLATPALFLCFFEETELFLQVSHVSATLIIPSTRTILLKNLIVSFNLALLSCDCFFVLH